MPQMPNRILCKRALRLQQGGKHPLFLFSLTGQELLSIADISRVSRDDAGKLIGYQRPEVRRHVQEIVEYLDNGQVVFPNSLILALSSKVRFKRSRGPHVGDRHAEPGVLELRLPGKNEAKPAWIVDGQQRALAVSKSKRADLPLPISAFVADDVELQRDQFLRVNNTKPLPRGLITELLPEVSSPLPPRLTARKIPSAICDLLNQDPHSPFQGLIRRSSTPSSESANSVIADSSIVKMLEESLSSPTGVLFPYRNLATGETDFDGIWRVLIAYWTAVKRTFPDAWGLSPTKSRLMHGAGIRAMGRLMDRVMSNINPIEQGAAVAKAQRELARVRPICRWTSGVWEDLDDFPWNEIQNVPRHIRMLSSVLIRAYILAIGRTS